MDLKAATKMQADLATWVWWDITRCPVPTDVDARRVGPFIRRALKSLGYNGAVTITAIGILTEVPWNVLQALCSTGINLYHVPTTNNSAILTSLFVWERRNPAPANLMLISLQRLFGGWIAALSESYYILGSKIPYDRELDSSIYTSRAWCFLWESLLASLRAYAMDSNPAALEEDCSGTGGSTFYCSACDLDLLDFGDLKRHLQSKEHALGDLERYPVGFDATDESLIRMEDATAFLGRLKRFRDARASEEEEEELKRKNLRSEEEDEEDDIAAEAIEAQAEEDELLFSKAISYD